MFPRLATKTHKIDFINGLLDELQNLYGFAKVTFFPLSENMNLTFTKGLGKERQKMLHYIPFTDKITNMHTNIAGVCRQNQLCAKIQFESLFEPESGKNIYQDVLPTEFLPERDPAVEKWRASNERSFVYLSGNKISVLIKSADQTNQFVI